MRTLIIGQAPAKDTVGKPAFSGKSGPKFADLLGVEHSRLWEFFDVMNLLDYYPGQPSDKTKRGDAFPMPEAKKVAKGMLKFMDERTVVFVGKNVARAFEVHSLEFFGWFVEVTALDSSALEKGTNFFRYCVVPHPSGISHFWNNPANVEEARTFMRSIPR